MAHNPISLIHLLHQIALPRCIVTEVLLVVPRILGRVPDSHRWNRGDRLRVIRDAVNLLVLVLDLKLYVVVLHRSGTCFRLHNFLCVL